MTIPVEMIKLPAMLSDFGISFQDGDKVDSGIGFPLPFCAPERYHNGFPSFASDIFSYGILFASIYSGSHIVYGESAGGISNLVGTMGPFPENWKQHYNGGAMLEWWYDHEKKLEPPRQPLRTLEAKLNWCRPQSSSEERKYAISVICKTLAYEPKDRPTAAGLLEDPDFRSLMSLV